MEESPIFQSSIFLSASRLPAFPVNSCFPYPCPSVVALHPPTAPAFCGVFRGQSLRFLLSAFYFTV